MTDAKLRARTCKDLAQMAKKKKIDGWHSMRKEQLIMALLRGAKNGSSKSSSNHRTSAKKAASASNSATQRRSRRIDQRVRQMKTERELSKNLSCEIEGDDNSKVAKDRLVALVRGPYWLHASWELKRQGVERAAAALRQHWHTARPVLRLLKVSADGTTNTSERVVRDIEIHGGVNDWYIDVPDPPMTYRLDIGYLAENGQYFSLARSNAVTTPTVGSGTTIDENWNEVARDFDKIYAMSGGHDGTNEGSDLRDLFEERLRRPMGSPAVTRFGAGSVSLPMSNGKFHFEVDAEMIVYGVVTPGSRVTMRGQPVELREDGSFTVRVGLADGRQVLPIVANTSNGTEQRTTVIAIERNTKKLETLHRDPEQPSPS